MKIITTLLLAVGALLALPSCQTMDTASVSRAPGSAIVNVKNRAAYKQQVLNSEKPVIVNFSSEICSFCTAMDAVTEVVAKRHSGNVRVVTMSMEDDWDLMDRLKVETAPTTMIFVKGKPIWRKAGLVPTQTIERNLAPHLLASPGTLAMTTSEE